MRLAKSSRKIQERFATSSRLFHLFTIWYPEVSKICFPHIEQIPFLNAQPTSTTWSTNHEKERYIWDGKQGEDEARTHHGSILLGSALQTVCSPYIYQRMAIIKKVSRDAWTVVRGG